MTIETIHINDFRFYLINGEYYPSVTSILKLKPNPILEKWKSSLTEEQVQTISEYTAERGEMIHYGTLRTYETKTIIQEPLDKDSLVYIRQYPQMKDEIRRVGRLLREFKQHFKLIPLSLEKVVCNHELGFAGRIDFVGYLMNGNSQQKIPILMDIKTSKVIYRNSLELQLAGYNLAIQKKAKKLFCLLLHPGETTIDDITIGAAKPHWSFREIRPNYQGFLALLRAFKLLEPRILAFGTDLL